MKIDTTQNKNFLLPIIIKQAKDGSIILKDPRPKRDFIFVDDVVECFIKAIEDDSLSFEIFNVGYGKSYSVNEVVEIVAILQDAFILLSTLYVAPKL